MATRTSTRNKTSRKRPQTEESRTSYAQKIADLGDRADAYEAELDETDLATILARFGEHYSPKNCILIAMQRPDATDVAGFKAWTDRGRCVRKGETGIAIYAPITPRTGSNTDGAEVTAPTDVPSGEPTKPKARRFRLAYVFDITQTGELQNTADTDAAE